MNIDIAAFHQTFFEEAAELLAELEGSLLQLEANPADPELLNRIFRCAHSIKGGSATFGFADIAHFTNGLETLLDLVRNGQIPVDKPLTQLFLEARDQLSALLGVARGLAAAAPDSQPVTLRIEAAISRGMSAPQPLSASRAIVHEDAASDSMEFGEPGVWGIWALPRRYHLSFIPGQDVLRHGLDLGLLLNRLAEAAEISAITCDLSRLPPLVRLDPEMCYLSWDVTFRSDQSREDLLGIFEFAADESEITLTEIADPVTAAGKPEDALPPMSNGGIAAGGTSQLPPVLSADDAGQPAAPSSPGTTRVDTQTLRVATSKVDKLLNLADELTINQSVVNEIMRNFSMEKLPLLVDAVGQMGHASRELQEHVMAVRMLPIKQAFARFGRLVRDLSLAGGKQIALKTAGEETELDKSIIDALVDPLTHLVRNAAGHGLEMPEERRAAGKPSMGTISLNAFQEGGGIIVEVSDDGRGLSRSRILEKAVERGWIAPDEPVPSDETLFSYVFLPGFSTAESVTELSGRGVGMDIVRKTIQGLGGSISLTSVEGQGTCFRIRLPLTMAIVDGLLLSVGGEIYILPLTSIFESIQSRPGDVSVIPGRSEVLRLRGEVVPVVRLHQVFGLEPAKDNFTEGLFVIVGDDGRKVALCVDHLITQSQVVIKSIETHYRKVDGIAGACILGNGRVALILDVPGLLHGMGGGIVSGIREDRDKLYPYKSSPRAVTVGTELVSVLVGESSS